MIRSSRQAVEEWNETMIDRCIKAGNVSGAIYFSHFQEELKEKSLSMPTQDSQGDAKGLNGV